MTNANAIFSREMSLSQLMRRTEFSRRGQPTMSSVGIQGQPKFREFFRRWNWNRFWNREPFGPGTV